MWGDSPGHYFRVFDATGREIEQVGEASSGTPALRTQVVFIRPGTSLTSTIYIEEHFPCALASGSCIAFQIPFYVPAPMRPDADQPGRRK